MFTKLLVLAMMSPAVPLNAQYVTLASPSEMLFSDPSIDPSIGVNFRYPASWKFSARQPFYMQLSISPPPDAELYEQLHGVVFTKSLSGVRAWPKTNFEGVELGYDEHQVANEPACRVLAQPDGNGKNPVDEATFGGIRYWHMTAGSAGLGHEIREDIYTTFVAKPGKALGSCLRFDLAESMLNVQQDGPLPALTPTEEATIRGSLLGILKTVSIAITPR
jgi:hypothetical protein